MNDKELADEVVVLGIGECHVSVTYSMYLLQSDFYVNDWIDAEEFVRDWRVAGALMEKVQEQHGYDAWQPDPDHYDMPLPRAIIEACVMALQEMG